MKRIAFLTDNLFSIGGVQRVLAVIAKALSATHDVTILTLESEQQADRTLYGLQDSTVQVRFISLSGRQSFADKAYGALYKKMGLSGKTASDCYAHSSFPLAMQQQLILALNSGGYDTVIAVHGGLSMKLATVRSALTAGKVLGWMHNAYDAFFMGRTPYFRGLRHHFRHQMAVLDGFIVLTEVDAARYRQEMGLHPFVIHNPLTLQPGQPSDGTSRRFLSIGRMVPQHKGFDLLIEAFARFAATDREWTLEIVGDGPERETLMAQARQTGVGERILFRPQTNDIQRHYSAAAVYVMASRWEGMPLVLAEALAHGLPVIAPTLPVCREVLSDDVALFFPTGDADALAEAMRQHARLLAKRSATIPYTRRFALPAILSQWLELV